MLVSVMRSVVFTRGTLHVALVISLLQPSGQEIHIRKAFNKDKVTWRVALRSERKLGHICRLESCYTNFASVIDSQFVSATATSVDLLQATRSNPLRFLVHAPVLQQPPGFIHYFRYRIFCSHFETSVGISSLSSLSSLS